VTVLDEKASPCAVGPNDENVELGSLRALWRPTRRRWWRTDRGRTRERDHRPV